MFYGMYKGVRESSWKCLDDFGIDSLPVDVLKIAYGAEINVVKNSIAKELSARENGKVLCGEDFSLIIYDDTQTVQMSRYVVAHELGHILLGHDVRYMKYVGLGNIGSLKVEQEADMFAQRILCPACVIWGLGLRTPEEIAKYFLVPQELAFQRAERMKILYKRNKFLVSENERKVYQNFASYIEQNKINKRQDC